jgi:hypothetical protein
MSNPYLAKIEREKLIAEIDKFFKEGGQVENLGHQMKQSAIPLVINPKKCIDRVKLEPSFTRMTY